MNWKNNFLLLLTVLTTPVITLGASLPPGFTESLVAQNLDPTDMVLTSDNRILITVKSGKVLIVEDGVLRASPLLNIEGIVDNYNERGLGHIVLDPDFDNNGYYYLYYTVKGENHNRVSRFTAIGNFSDPGSELIILELDVMAGTIHNAGDMDFGEDGKLYISVGDGADGNKAQSKSSLLGKVLRINPNGATMNDKIPTDNPFFADATFVGQYKLIYALGFRNPFSMDIQPVTGRIFISDVGGGAWEEVNHVQAGKNYGWPGIEGKRTGEALPVVGVYQDPLYAYAHGGAINEGCSIIGAVFYNPSTHLFPPFYNGRFFFADYCNGYIKSMNPENENDIQIFAENIDRPLAMIVAPDGSMYYLARAGLGGGSEGDNTSSADGTLWKITYTGSGVPSISVPPQDAIMSVGEDATFSVLASGNQPLSYQWQVNGVNIPGATQMNYIFANAQLTDNGKLFQCIVSNQVPGTVTSVAANLTVTSNTRPEPQIIVTLPDNAVSYKGGQVISISGSASDAEDGILPPGALTWKINFHHNVHFHPALGATTGLSSISYIIPTVGETSSDVWYRVSLTAKDEGNPSLSKTTYQDIFPLKSTITLLTEPPGLNVFLDGQTVTTPHTFSSVVNISRFLDAPSTQVANNNLYLFDHWSEPSTEKEFQFETPETNKTFTAFFTGVPTGDGAGLTGYYFSDQDKTFEGSPSLVRVDPAVNFDWGGESPAPELTADHFTVRWLGEVLPQLTDNYTFYMVSDDGVRLWINNNQLIDKWIDQGAFEWSGEIELQAGEKYPVKIEYYENGGDAIAKLYWSSSKLSKQLIPTSQLSSDFITASEENAVASIWLYPTLANETIFIEYRDTKRLQWQIVSSLGIRVMSGEMQESVAIPIDSFPIGLYLFKTGDKTIRFIKK